MKGVRRIKPKPKQKDCVQETDFSVTLSAVGLERRT